MKNKNMEVLIVLVLFCFLGMFSISCMMSADNSYINDWAVSNNYVIKSNDLCFVDTGPFWFRDKNQRIYRITLDNGRVFYMRTGIFCNEILEWR
jgi:hypothetical protein